MPLEIALWYSDGIKGANTKGGRVDSSALVEFQHKVYHPVDKQEGTVTGARVHDSVTFLKEIDTASCPLYQACCDGRTLESFEIKWYRINKVGQEEHYFTHTLKNVKIASVEQVLPNTKDPSVERQTHLERVDVLYETINWKHEDGFEYEDSWSKEPGG